VSNLGSSIIVYVDIQYSLWFLLSEFDLVLTFQSSICSSLWDKAVLLIIPGQS